jgi:hypothetical protein
MRKNEWQVLVENARDVNEAITVRELLRNRYSMVPNNAWEFKSEGTVVKGKGFTTEYGWRTALCIAEGIIIGYREGYEVGYGAGIQDANV